MKKGTLPKGTIEVAIKLRGEPGAVVHALANGLPLEALEGIRDGMTAELERRLAKPARGRRTITIRGKVRK